MSSRTLSLTPQTYDYLLTTVREPSVLAELRAETARLPEANMQISPEQGRFLTFLIEALGVNRAIELGVFTGYSSICVALGLPATGRLVACDVSDEYTRVAQRYWQRAGVSDKIELQLGPAVETLARLVSAGAAGTFDFAFVDADKENYASYFDSCLTLLRPGGVIAFDNALWGGSVADPSDERASTVAVRELNRRVVSDARVSSSLLPIGDGLLLVRKR